MDKMLPGCLSRLSATAKLVWLYVDQYPGHHSVRSLQAALGITAGRALSNLVKQGLLIQEEAPQGRRLGKYRTAPLQTDRAEPVERLAPTSAPVQTAAPLYRGVSAVEMQRIWERATFTGVRRMVLQVEAAAPSSAHDNGRLEVRVLDTERWPDWTDADGAQAAALAAVVTQWAKLDELIEAMVDPDGQPQFWSVDLGTELPIRDPEQMN
ncbi:MAG: hypothetical protein JWQ08_2108 [Deinococcus sp.]|jgi:hypothetical protein|nr:hypothetical protein [Deinococcus sp.]